MKKNTHEILLAGALQQDAYSDFQWVQRAPHGNWAIRVFGFVLRKAFRRACTSITFDYASFEAARARIAPEQLLVLAPTHRSMMDFLVCSYLCFAHPELRIAIPYIAADLQLGQLPFLGWFLKQAYAFYLKRGQGKADPELNARLQQLVAAQQTLEIFIEGTRSRSRQCLPPKRGFLRALQHTGVTCSLLPITISYDRVPEEAGLLKELQGAAKPLMRLKPLLAWCLSLLKGQVKLGRVHLVCGTPVEMQPGSDVHAVSQAVMAQLQTNYVVSTFHLAAFLQQQPQVPYTLEQLIQAIQKRGGTVIESPLLPDLQLEPIVEYTFRHQWQHWFIPDLLAAFPEHPLIQNHAQQTCFVPAYRRPAPQYEPDIQPLLEALFQPLTHACQQLMTVASQDQGLPFASPRAFVARYPRCFLPVVEEVLVHLCEVQVLEKSETGFKPGPAWFSHAKDYLTPPGQSQLLEAHAR